MKCLASAAVAATLGVLASGTARATDTIETFDEGAMDLELYGGVEGLGLARDDPRLFGDTTLGYGIVDRLSGYLRGAGSTNDQLAEESGELGTGLFGTPLDSDHVDLDLIIDLSVDSAGPAVTPGVEINLDAAPDQAFWGAYLRAEERFAGREEATGSAPPGAAVEEAAEPEPELAPVTAATLGLYLTMADDHQLLVEANGLLRNNPAEDEHALDLGGVALGYNVALHESFELINQLCLDVPVREDESFAAGLVIGFIATIDPGGMAPGDATTPSAKARPRRLSSFRPGR